MYEWFHRPESEFHLFGTAHLLTMAVFVCAVVAFYLFRRRLRNDRDIIRISVGWVLLFSRVSISVWYVATDNWAVEESLPFHLCNLAAIFCGIMLLTMSRYLFEIFYFIAIGGAMQAILTPNLSEGFPQFLYFQFFLSHFFIFLAPLILCWLYDFTVTIRALLKSFAALNGIAAAMYGINRLLSANYMFLMHKPETASLLDYLGPYPYYILSLEAVALLIYVLLYVPFALRRRGRLPGNSCE